MVDEEKSFEDRRRYPRVNKTFVVSFSRYGEAGTHADISQTRNISLGGILLTTDIQYAPGTVLTLKLRLPVQRDTVNVLGRVITSKRIVNKLIYDTHIEFMEIDEANREALEQTMNLFLKKEEGKNK